MTNAPGGRFAWGARYRALAQNAAFLFSLRAMQHSLRLVVVYFVVRALSQASFGDYQLILSYVTLMGIFTLPGLQNSVMQSVARGFEGIYRLAVPRSLLCSLIGVAILAGMGFYHRLGGRVDLGSGFFVAALLFAPYGMEQWRAFRSGKEDFAGIFRIGAIGAVALTVLMIAGVKRIPGNLLVPLTVLLGVQAVTNLIMTWRTLGEVPRDAPTESGSVAYGTRTTIYNAFNTLANQTDKLLIFHFLSPVSLAIYYAADRIPELTKGVVQDVAGVLAPRFAKTGQYSRELHRKLGIMGLIAAAITAALAFTILPWAVRLLFGADYDGAVPYAQALMCSVAIANVIQLRARFVLSRLDESSARTYIIGMSLVRIVASVVLIPIYGILGAVISALIYRTAMVLIVNIVIRRKYLQS